MNEVRNSIIAALREAGLSGTALSTWFSDCELLSLSESDCILGTTSELKRQTICSYYPGQLRSAVRQAVGREVNVRVVVRSEAANAEPVPRKAEPSAPCVCGRFRFEDFITGTANELAYRASVAAADHPGRPQNNPLFLYGGSGLGKTHLLCAIGQRRRAVCPDTNVLYLTGEQFVSGLVSAIRTRSTEAFRARLNAADLLLVDDVEIMAGKDATQAEFFSLFNDLYARGCQIVMTSDRPPKELPTLEERLRTRFEGGIMADIRPPDPDTRLRLVRRNAERSGLRLSDAQIRTAAEHLRSNVRQIEGFLNSLAACSEICGSQFTDTFFFQTMRRYVNVENRTLTADGILAETARCFSLTADDLCGRSQTAAVTRARQISMYLTREQLGLSLTEIGLLHGGRDHSTVLNSIRKIDQLLETDAALSAAVGEILLNLKGQTVP